MRNSGYQIGCLFTSIGLLSCNPRELCHDAAPLAVDPHENVGGSFQRCKLSSYKFSGTRSASCDYGCFSIHAHPRLVECHGVMYKRTRFYHRQKFVLFNNFAVRIHNDPIISDETFNRFCVVLYNRLLEILLELQQLLDRFVIHSFDFTVFYPRRLPVGLTSATESTAIRFVFLSEPQDSSMMPRRLHKLSAR